MAVSRTISPVWYFKSFSAVILFIRPLKVLVYVLAVTPVDANVAEAVTAADPSNETDHDASPVIVILLAVASLVAVQVLL